MSRENGVAALSDGSVYRWGRFRCEVGIGTTNCGYYDDSGLYEDPTRVAAPVTGAAVGVTAGTQHALVLTSEGTVWGWGVNASGQLGDGTRTWRTSPVAARPPFTVASVLFDTVTGRPVGVPGNGTVTVLTPAHAAGKVDVVVTTRRANGSAGPNVRYSGAFSFGVAPKITTGAPPAGTTKAAYSFAFKASGTGPVTFTVSAGALPAGLTLNGTTGLLSGTPTTPGTSSFTVKATNAFGSVTVAYSVSVAAGVPPKITSAAPLAALTKLPYAHAVKTTGTGPMTYTISAGALPLGLTLNAATGVISGTPTTVGPKTFSVKVASAWGTTSATYTVAVTAGTAPKITATAPPVAVVGAAYSYRVATTGTAPLTFAIASGTLPTGLTLNATTGVVSGTPTVAGAKAVTVRATNPWGMATSTALTLTVRTP